MADLVFPSLFLLALAGWVTARTSEVRRARRKRSKDMTNRLYTDTANSYSILKGAVLQGLGRDDIIQKWPKGRSYHDVSLFRAPYVRSYFQSGSLLGLGAPPSTIAAAVDASAPPDVKRFLLSGEPVPKLVNNVSLPTNQVPRWAYGVMAVGAAALSYVSYKRFKKTAKGHGG